jgi:hypothetical protein
LTLRRVSRLFLLLPFFLLWVPEAKADTQRITEPTDLWFTYTEPSLFFVRTLQADGYGSDPMLWLYTSEGQLIAENDDYYGLQSRLEVQLQPGTYRLRAGVCCGDPTRWWPGVVYDLTTTASVVSTTTTSSSTTTTTVEPTTTTEAQTTTTEPEPSTTSVVDTTMPETTTTTSTTTTSLPPVLAPETTTTTVEAQTTVAVSQTSTTSYGGNPQDTTTTVMTTTTTAPAPTTSSRLPLPTSTTTSTIAALPTLSTQVETKSPAPSTTTPEPAVTSDAFYSSPEKVEELVEVLDELSDEELAEVAEALSSAPVEVKKKFESEVNVYSGDFDNYVPAGSTIPIQQRRVLIAIGATMMSSAAVVRRK